MPFFAEANARESQDSKTVVVMRYSYSCQLPPKSDAAQGENTRPVTKTLSAVLHVKRIVGSEKWLMRGGKEPERNYSGGVWGPGAGFF